MRSAQPNARATYAKKGNCWVGRLVIQLTYPAFGGTPNVIYV